MTSLVAIALSLLPLVTGARVAGSAAASAPARPAVVEGGFELYRGLARASAVEVVCAEPELFAAVDRAIALVQDDVPQSLVRVTPEESRAERPRVVVGTLAEPTVRALAERAGLVGAEAPPALRLGPTSYPRAGEAICATLADPDRPGLPLTLHVANAARVLAAELEDVAPYWRPWAEVRRDGLPLLVVELDPGGAPRWETAVDVLERRRERAGGVTGLEPARGLIVRVGQGVDAARAEGVARLAAEARAAVAFAFGAPPPPLELLLCGRLDAMRAGYGATGLSYVPPSAPSGALVLCAAGLPHDGGAAAARAAALAILGPPDQPWIYEGVGTGFASTWFGRPREAWIAALARAGDVPTAAELAAPGAPHRIGAHVLGPLRGELVRALLDLRGPEALARAWRGDEPIELGPEVEAALRARVDRALELHGAELDRLRAARRAQGPPAWLGGVHLVPGAPDGAADLARPGVARSLADARDAGANAVALAPLAWIEPRPLVRAGERRPAWPDATPDDLEIAHAVHAARALGLSAMLAPQVILTPGGTWAAAQALGGDEGIDSFFDGYGRAVLHYAMLAELLGVDVLCLGNDLELVTTTRPSPTDDAAARERRALLRARWSDLIARVRAIYGGALTYSAQIAWELDRVEIWDELDLVGVELFPTVPPPSRRHLADAGEVRITNELEKALAVARERGKKLLIVQTGYPAHDLAHERPLLARGPVDLEAQERLYRLLGAALRGPADAGELAGVFVWRWDPDPAAGGGGDPSHTPQRKPAAAVLRTLLAR